MNSNEIMKAINEIANTPGKNDKLALLTKYMENDEFQIVMCATYNPFTTFGVRPPRLAVLDSIVHETPFGTETWSLLSNLNQRQLTGDAAKNAINEEMTRLGSDSRELLWRILNKDLKAGFSESSLNKVRKGLIPEFPYMRCSLPKDVKFEEWPWATGIISQIKADGMFFNGNVEAGIQVNITTRQGQPMPVEGFEELAKQLDFIGTYIGDSDIAYEKGLQTHGELLVKFNGEVLPRQIGNGLINKLKQGTPLPEGHVLTAVIWDVVPLHNVSKGEKFELPYLKRLRWINSAIGMLQAGRGEPLVEAIETRVVRSYKEAMEHYYDARRRALEGTIAKKPSMPWKDGTSKDQVKLKQEVPVELEVEGFEEGKEGAKTAETFGSLKCKTSDGMLKVNVGTGFSDELRKEINDNRDDWMGAIITVKSNEIMYAARGKLVHSLFLPVFEERRYDKSIADTFEQVVVQFESAVK